MQGDLALDDSHKRYKRTYVACLNCRVRKVKCDLGNLELPKDKCARCQRERRDCVFVDSKKRSVNKIRDLRSDSTPPPESGAVSAKPVKHFSTMEGALVFLANAAGKIATADERDKIDGQSKHAQLERRHTYSGLDLENLARESTSNVERTSALNSNADTPLHSPGIPPYINRPFNPHKRLQMPPARDSYAIRPRGSNELAEIEFVGSLGILTVDEAIFLVDMFFLTMHPFFPHIPKFLHLPQVLAGYPILLCAILTISLRYHELEGTGQSVARNVEVHDRLWLYMQQLISQTVWAEASTRSIGTVFAFLLFTEWNPRAIHWRWSDYANKADDNAETRAPTLGKVPGVSSDEPTGLGAMRRSHRMAWMLIGSAVRLAQDTGFMELSSKTFLATHVAEINSVMNMSRRSMLSHSLAEVGLDNDDISESEMEQREDNEHRVLNMSEEDQRKVSLENSLRLTRAQRAQIELLQIMSLGHESLYGYKAQLGSLNQRQNLLVLNIMNPMIVAWGRNYQHFLVPSSSKFARKITPETLRDPESKVSRELADIIQNETFIFDYNYLKLYLFSLALSPSPETKQTYKNGNMSLKLDEITRSSKYIEQAFTAANEILLTAHRVHKLKMLRFMPVRWVTRIVRAVAFIVKCYLTITAHKSKFATDRNVTDFDLTVLSLSLISVEEIAHSIQRAAITLRDCSPDELHLCTRYSNVLMYLYSEMKNKLKTLSDEDDEATAEFGDRRPEQPVPNADVTDNFLNENELMDWFMSNRNVGLDFVGPWTEMIEQQLHGQQFSFDDGFAI